MARKPYKLRSGEANLRGRTVLLEIEGRQHSVTVVTHLRANLWQVAGPNLPVCWRRPDGTRRCTVERSEITVPKEQEG